MKLNPTFVREVSCCCCFHHELEYYCILDVCTDWIVRNGICYRKFNDGVTAEGAVSLCQENNAYLAEIPNIHVDNIITEIVREDREECWIGLRTNDTHYYWLTGDFPLGEDTPSETNECGTIYDIADNRWHLHNCTTPQFCTICMIGKQSL